MTRLQKEIDSIIDSMMFPKFPTRYSQEFTNVGSSYPPYNIIRRSDTETVLEIAVAGFSESELNVVVEEDVLKISGKKEPSDETTDYLYKGIGTRAFERSFALSKDSKVVGADYTDGILLVYVKYEIPEEKKPKTIPVRKTYR